MIEISIEVWQKFTLSILIGLLVGLERVHTHLEREGVQFAGIKTFPWARVITDFQIFSKLQTAHSDCVGGYPANNAGFSAILEKA